LHFVFIDAAAPKAPLHTSPHGDQPQPLIQGGAIFRKARFKTKTTGIFQMKGIIAACIAVGVLRVVDIELNGSRYRDVVKRAVTSVLRG
jgi:hypothetical protein